MKRIALYILPLSFFVGLFLTGNAQQAPDTTNLPFKINPQGFNPYEPPKPSSNINFKNPENLSTEVEFDQESNQYIIHRKAGTVDYSTPYTMSFEEYVNYDVQKNLQTYWRDRYKNETFENQSSIIPKINIGSEAFETIFGSNTIDIRPQGMASLKFGVKIAYSENPNQPIELRRNTTFDFKEEIQMSVVGKIGDNLEMRVNYDTESQFDFDNTMKLAYQGKEDDIIQKIEAGDVSLPLTTSLITGSQSLFGVLTELKFGNLYVSSVFSQQEGETKTITVEGGAQKSEYDFSAAEYDKNRHFFLSHYFREHYDEFLKDVNLLRSPINITKVEVWVTNTTRSTTNARNMVALLDLGEEKEYIEMYGRTEKVILGDGMEITGGKSYPDNSANTLYENVLGTIQVISGDSIERSINNISRKMAAAGFQGGKHFEKVEYARKLDSRDYTLNNELGYISLNTALNADEVLAVAFEYTVSGTPYKVGEFAQDGIEHPNVLVLKLLKGTNFTPSLPNWDLMMKNVYSIGAYQINRDDFIFDVEYYDDAIGTRVLNVPISNAYDKYIHDTISIKNDKFVRLLNLDNLNSQGNYVSIGDGVFDFVEGITILSSNGRVIFPMVEPFGGYIREKIKSDAAGVTNDPVRDELEKLANKMAYQELYDSTQYKAEQVTTKNKYYLKGSYKSSGGSEIFLNSFNIPQGSVKVSAGGIILTENVDYTVDYNLGRVKILNESYITSGTPIKISLESNSLFSIQSKTLMGTHLDYRFNPDFNLGATIMNLTERPLTEKVGMGEEPINNTIWGLNGSYRTDVPFLTRAIDFLPFLETKEMSSITVEGEFAHLIPGHNKAIGKSGNAFIDDFEGSESSIDIKNKTGWVLASVPQLQTDSFPEASLFDDLAYGFNRAKLAWYQIDPSFHRSGSPVSAEIQSSLKVYRVDEQDIFPNKETPNGIPTEISTLDLAFYPEEKGPYNYDVLETSFSAGIDSEGYLNEPTSRWGGIMRELTTNDFEAQNIEYIMFWMMDPFVEDSENNPGGDLYFNLGNVSEDILKDGRKSYEHGLSTADDPDPNDFFNTVWGLVPAIQPLTDQFVNDPDLRVKQDIGLDGINSTEEANTFINYLNSLNGVVNNDVLEKIQSDPSNDDFVYWKGDSYSENATILERYKNFNNHEGNSKSAGSGSVEQEKTTPDVEDINGDFTLSEAEAYFQYRVHLDKDDMVVGSNYITDVRNATANLKNNETREVKWYQFKIPVNEGQAIGNIQDFKSIRFMRMFMRGWQEEVVLRFAKLELVRSEWRKYDYAIKEGGELVGDSDESHDPSSIPFTVASVNIEENGSRYPVNYVLPPGVDRQQDPSNPQLTQLNEQSMVLRVRDLEDGYAKAVYKTLNMDMRDYGKLQMYIHAESLDHDTDEVSDGDIRCFVRLGSDFTDNYYEYEVPLEITAPWIGQTYNQFSDVDRLKVWPIANNMEIDFNDLVDAKLARNDEMRREGSTLGFTDVYAYNNGSQRIIVKGNPNIANVKTIMIGIRNPKAKYNNLSTDDGNAKSAEIWVNELRLTDFDEHGGWAATGRMTARLADFGTFSFAGSTTQPGFGSIEQNAQERAKEETNQIDVSTNLELGKFFPKEANVRVPMFIGYSRTAINPEYNPLDQDVLLETSLNDPNKTEEEKKQLVNQVQDLTERKSINFTNVGVGKTGKGKTRFYSPSNLSATYSYSELNHHDVGIDHDVTKDYLGSLNYIFNNQPKNIRPFKKSKILRKPAFKIIGDFNFYYAPQQVSLRTTMNRRYNETLLRNLNNPEQNFDPTYNKNFTWTRQFDLKYNLTKSLKFDFSTNTNALIEEPDGSIDRSNKSEYDQYKEDVWHSIKNMGTPNTYNQKFNASYTIPINKIPLFDWVSSNARYSATYQWDAGARVSDPNLDPGNTIKNTRQISLNNQFRMDNLYNKVGFLDKINKKYKKSKKQRNAPKFEDVTFIKEDVRFKSGTAKKISHNLDTEEDIRVKTKGADGKDIKNEFEIINSNKIEVILENDHQEVTIEVTGKKEIKNNPIIVGLEQSTRMFMGFKQLSASYSVTNGSMLSGYQKDHDFGSLPNDPGMAFIFGWQDDKFGYNRAANRDLIEDSTLISPFVMTSNETWNFKANYQPFRELRIDFDAKRSYSNNTSEYFYYDIKNPIDPVQSYDRKETGSYNFSFWMLSSAFTTKPTLEKPTSETFEKYKENLLTQAWKLADARGPGIEKYKDNTNYQDVKGTNTNIFPAGYSSTNPDVAIPAFLAAYGNTEIDDISNLFNPLNMLKTLKPSWRVKFDGLKNLDFVAKYFKNVSIAHGYNSSFAIGGFSSNLLYDFDSHQSWALGGVDSTFFVSQYDISSFSATEQFVPLIGVDLTWKNNVLTKFEYKKTRNLTMSLANNQMTEVYTWEYTIGSGYRFDKLKLKINNKEVISDLNVRADVSIRNNLTVQHDLAQDVSTVTQGQKVVTMKLTADYKLSDNLTLQAYFDRNMTNPMVGSFKTANTEFGFMVRFSLADLK